MTSILRKPGTALQVLALRLAPVAMLAVNVPVLAAPVAAQDAPELPDPLMTPGAVDPSVTLSDICNGTTKGGAPSRRRPEPRCCGTTACRR